MGLCEHDEQDLLAGRGIADLSTFPRACPECLADLSEPENEGLETCPYCSAVLGKGDD